ncbi:interferon-induced, double-stranded RNA-activated kinase [Pelobates cultripes]|uniref:non-specific serine/threonine protein kinase n=1 Tax=Pelobates cultripes TaxID=61616 RepID=A0AAD1RG07_PELCU|nr:interferon-induced, double-stranded RNA-activated kinase [Pelobates cultripes]
MRGPHSRIAAAILTEGNFAALFARGPRHSDREGRELIGPYNDHMTSRCPSALNSSPVENSLSVTDESRENTFGRNYTGKCNELCQRKKWPFAVFLHENKGPSHIPEFFCSVKIDKRTFSKATGKSKKEAQQNAAFNALLELKRENPSDPEIPDVTRDSASPGSLSASNASLENGSSTTKSSLVLASNLTPTAPTKSVRRVELAANFTKLKIHTCDESFLRDFDNISPLGSGGFGTIFKARKKMEDKYYVVKKVMFHDQKSILEVKALANLEHPNIVRYFHSWTGQDYSDDDSMSGSSDVGNRSTQVCLFIQMELCKYGTLREWMEKRNKIDKERSLDIFRQIIEGVVFIHSNKLIHRDLKPENIFFATESIIKIGDFGLATPMSEENEKQAICRTQGTGTKSYMAPEQEEATYENEVDIFPLGLILIELFMKFGTVMERQKEWRNIRNAELPLSFTEQYPSEESYIRLMLSKDPKKRPTASKLNEYFDKQSFLYSRTV